MCLKSARDETVSSVAHPLPLTAGWWLLGCVIKMLFQLVNWGSVFSAVPPESCIMKFEPFCWEVQLCMDCSATSCRAIGIGRAHAASAFSSD